MNLPEQAEQYTDARTRFLSVAGQLAGLPLVEQVIRSKLVSDARLLEEIPQYLLSLGGKRIRPVLTLLVQQLFTRKAATPELVDVAAGIELIHMATLLHDDIIDRSALRRHKTSPFFVYGLPGTLLAGDFLLVRAFALCAHLDQFIIDATERACVELTEGEILETSLQRETHSIASSLQIAQKKTASLFRLSCETASFLSGCDEQTISDMARYGEDLGIAFQIVDDILDVVSSEEKLGKKPGTDIRERKPSLVNVLWLESGDVRAQQVLVDEASADIPDAEIQQILTHLTSGDVLVQAKQKARSYVESAQSAFDRVVERHPDLDPLTLDALRALAEYALERME